MCDCGLDSEYKRQKDKGRNGVSGVVGMRGRGRKEIPGKI